MKARDAEAMWANTRGAFNQPCNEEANRTTNGATFGADNLFQWLQTRGFMHPIQRKRLTWSGTRGASKGMRIPLNRSYHGLLKKRGSRCGLMAS